MISCLKSIISSFRFAFRGIFKAILQERNLRIHLLATFIVLLFGFILHISILEWLILLIIIGLVISAEIFNASLEELGNVVKKELKLDYGVTALPRDFAAGAVLVLAITAVIIGLIIFLPKIVFYLK